MNNLLNVKSFTIDNPMANFLAVSSESVDSESTQTQTQAPTVPADPNAQGAQGKQQSPYSSIILLVLMFVAMYFILFRGPRKQQKKRKELVQALDKNDRVQTIGGMMGTIIDIKDDEVTLKIDESNNTKIKILASAISKNISKEKTS